VADICEAVFKSCGSERHFVTKTLQIRPKCVFTGFDLLLQSRSGVLSDGCNLMHVRTGAPRLLQAIAADGVIPFINPFSVTNLKGEPRRALYLTATIAETGVLLANVDYIAPIITMCVLIFRAL